MKGALEKVKKSPHISGFFVWEMLFIFDLFGVLHVVSAGSCLGTYVHTKHVGSSPLNTKLMVSHC